MLTGTGELRLRSDLNNPEAVLNGSVKGVVTVLECPPQKFTLDSSILRACVRAA